jgi:hypothetical protein
VRKTYFTYIPTSMIILKRRYYIECSIYSFLHIEVDFIVILLGSMVYTYVVRVYAYIAYIIEIAGT